MSSKVDMTKCQVWHHKIYDPNSPIWGNYSPASCSQPATPILVRRNVPYAAQRHETRCKVRLAWAWNDADASLRLRLCVSASCDYANNRNRGGADPHGGGSEDG